MERFSNNYPALRNQVKVELSHIDLTESEQCIFRYSASPWFANDHFSIALIHNDLTNAYQIIEKTWDNEYDFKRFSTGVYNLDRLCIHTNIVKIDNEQEKELQKLIQNISFVPETLESTDYIMLDGIEYELIIKTLSIDKKYEWKLPTEDIKYFKPIIDFMKAIC